MKNLFLASALGASLLLAVFISPFASNSPDGLEKVAENHGFARLEKTERRAYIPQLAESVSKNESEATGVAGFAGAMLALAVGVGLARTVSRGKNGGSPGCKQ